MRFACLEILNNLDQKELQFLSGLRNGKLIYYDKLEYSINKKL